MYKTQACPDEPDVMFAQIAPVVVEHLLLATDHPDNPPDAGEKKSMPEKVIDGFALMVTGN